MSGQALFILLVAIVSAIIGALVFRLVCTFIKALLLDAFPKLKKASWKGGAFDTFLYLGMIVAGFACVLALSFAFENWAEESEVQRVQRAQEIEAYYEAYH